MLLNTNHYRRRGVEGIALTLIVGVLSVVFLGALAFEIIDAARDLSAQIGGGLDLVNGEGR